MNETLAMLIAWAPAFLIGVMVFGRAEHGAHQLAHNDNQRVLISIAALLVAVTAYFCVFFAVMAIINVAAGDRLL